jgi:hypothetical protein
MDLGDNDITSLDKLEFFDTAVYIDGGADGYLDLEADTAIRFLGPMTTSENLASTGLLSGGVVTKSTGASYTIGTTSAAECYGGVIYATGAGIDVTACDNLAAGMSFTVITVGAVQVDLDVQADDLMILDGTTLNDGDKAVNTSTTGDMIVCTYYDATGWYCASGSNDGDLWTDGG